MPPGPAHLEQRARRIEVDAHAEIEVGLSLAADDRREMEDRGGLAVDHAGEECGIRDVPGDRHDPRVGGGRRGRDVHEREAIDPLRLAVGPSQRSALEQRPRQALTEKAGAAGNDDVHRGYALGVMRSSPPMYERSASGTTIDPSACW